MDNKENYKKAFSNIHASEKLKQETLNNLEKNNTVNNSFSKLQVIKLLSTCAAVFLVLVFGLEFIPLEKNRVILKEVNTINVEKDESDDKEVADENVGIDLPRFKNMEELKLALDKNQEKENYYINKDLIFDMALTESAESMNSTATKGEHSTTNVQVEGVEEADIIKTDGEYIYYTTNNKVFIVKADSLEIESEIKISSKNENYYISQMYLKDNKLVLIGIDSIIEEPIINNVETNDEYKTSSQIARVKRTNLTKVLIYDINDKVNPKLVREAALEGSYVQSRMVGDYLYFMSRRYSNYYVGMEENKILPIYTDANETKTVNCTEIIHLEDTESNTFMLVGGLNINEENDLFVETFFGAGDIVYANENNLYLTKQWYYRDSKTTIYKFRLNKEKINLVATAEIDGTLNNQFSMDEYDGNLRVATTSNVIIEEDKYEELGDGISRVTRGESTTVNNLFILDEDLNEIGKIENLALDEKIYSVRFIGEIGYIVTFKQIDPLFVIDLSDPRNPVVKGELKIPGYSSYLHPYDEKHIIGIGYNTKDNGYGGITNSTMKMSMFDVSDLENPKEIFNVDIGNEYASSEIMYDHKVLFYKKSENLIGFPVTYRERNYRDDANGFVIYKIDLENNEFTKHGEVLNKINYLENVRRIIYIDNVLYALSESKIISYDLNTFEKIDEVLFERDKYGDISIVEMID